MKKLFVLCSLLFPSMVFAEVARIKSTRFDRGSVMTIYLAPGLGSLLMFPCSLEEVFVGRSDDVSSQISTVNKKNLYLNLRLNSSLPTNLIAKCEEEKNVFVLDIIPSKSNHQDLVDIRSAYGRAKSDEPLNESSRPSVRKIVKSKPVVIEKGPL